MSNWFASWFDTEYYHQLYNHRDESEAERFIETVLNYLNLPKHARLLDIACGKGRHAKAIADHDYEVVGIDLSENSIEEAKQMQSEHLSFFVQDMREPFRENEFDAAFNFFTSFGYFASEEDDRRAALSMTTCLKKGGVLLIDFVNKAHALANIEANRHELQERGLLRFTIERKYDAGRYIKDIQVADGDVVYHFQESLQSLTLQDFESFFLPLGMHLKKVFGNYDLKSYDENKSPRLILLFEKV